MITDPIKITRERADFKKAFKKLSPDEQTFIVNALFYRTERTDVDSLTAEKTVKETCRQFAMYLMSGR